MGEPAGTVATGLRSDVGVLYPHFRAISFSVARPEFLSMSNPKSNRRRRISDCLQPGKTFLVHVTRCTPRFGIRDRSSQPHSLPSQTPAGAVESVVLRFKSLDPDKGGSRHRRVANPSRRQPPVTPLATPFTENPRPPRSGQAAREPGTFGRERMHLRAAGRKSDQERRHSERSLGRCHNLAARV
jgi:hypothetical protein